MGVCTSSLCVALKQYFFLISRLFLLGVGWGGSRCVESGEGCRVGAGCGEWREGVGWEQLCGDWRKGVGWEQGMESGDTG
jgi:hypothetical protein